MTMIVFAAAATILATMLGCVAVLSVVAGARAEERELHARGCTCEYPRDGQHPRECPLA